MCNWRSAPPSGSTPHTTPPSTPMPALPPSPADIPRCRCWGGLGLCCHQAAGLSAAPQTPPCSFFLLSAALLGVTGLLKQCWHLYQPDLTLCPPHPLLSSCTAGSITLQPELLTPTYEKTKSIKRKMEKYKKEKKKKVILFLCGSQRMK